MSTLLGVVGIFGGGFSVMQGMETGNTILGVFGVVFALSMLAAASIINSLQTITTTLQSILDEFRGLDDDQA